MKNKLFNIIFSITLLGAIAAGIFIWQNQLDTREYIKKIYIKRTEINNFMKSSERSPFDEDGKEVFSGLRYFSPDPKYRIKAKLHPIRERERISIPMTDGSVEKYIRFAFAELTIDNRVHNLLLLKPETDGQTMRLFLAFTDETSGRQTYGGGRYIDIQHRGGRGVTIDFNEAYNPYCVYNYEYACPLPPEENHLEVPIFAGEKNYADS
jgi:uncharacterized protein (DUF1684 family)